MVKLKSTKLIFVSLFLALSTTNFFLFKEWLLLTRESELVVLYSSKAMKSSDGGHVSRIDLKTQTSNMSRDPSDRHIPREPFRNIFACQGLEGKRVILQDEWEKLMKLGIPQRKPIPHIHASQKTPAEDADISIAITLFARVRQLSFLLDLAKQWTGPVSIAIHIPNWDEIGKFFTFFHESSCELKKFSFHFLLDTMRSVDDPIPVSDLMNLAIKNTRAEFVFNLDIGFLPCDGSYPRLLKLLHEDKDVLHALNDHTLLVIPGFEWKLNNLSMKPPLNRTTLLKLKREKIVRPLRMPKLAPKSKLVNYGLWPKNEEGPVYPTSFLYGSEPFVIARKQGLPPYRNSLARLEWIEECDAFGYKLWVVRSLFVFKNCTANLNQRPNQEIQSEYSEFRNRLPDRYQRHFAVPTVDNFASKPYDDDCLSKYHSASRTERHILCEWLHFSASSDHRRQVARVIRGNFTFTSADISVATQGSVDRLGRLSNIAQYWDGPISMAVYIKTIADIQKTFEFFSQHEYSLSKVTVHFFFEKLLSTRDKLYPHNYLRNCALNFTDSDYVINLDIDFVPNIGAYSGLVRLVRTDENVRTALNNKTLLVLPAFESGLDTHDSSMTMSLGIPHDKKELLRELFKSAEPFHLKKFPPGHSPTDFGLWYVHCKGRFSSYPHGPH